MAKSRRNRKRQTARRRAPEPAASQRLTLVYVEKMLRALADQLRRFIDGG